MILYDKEYFQSPEAPKLECINEVKDLPYLMKYLSPKAGDRILDVGCGVGRLSNVISKGGALVTGIDISKYAIEQAKETYKSQEQLEFVCANALETDYKDYFDKVFCFHIIEHLTLQNARLLLKKMHCALKERGILVIGLPINDDYLFRRAIHFIAKRRSWRYYGHLTSFSIEHIKSEIETAGFKITDNYRISYLGLRVDKWIPQFPILGLPTICVDIRAEKR